MAFCSVEFNPCKLGFKFIFGRKKMIDTIDKFYILSSVYTRSTKLNENKKTLNEKNKKRRFKEWFLVLFNVVCWCILWFMPIVNTSELSIQQPMTLTQPHRLSNQQLHCKVVKNFLTCIDVWLNVLDWERFRFPIHFRWIECYFIAFFALPFKMTTIYAWNF